MVTKIIRVALLFTSLALGAEAAPAQAQPPPPPPPAPLQVKPPDVGRLEGVNYVNDFFGLSLAVPQDWIFVGGAQRNAVMDESVKLLKSEDARRQQQLEASVRRSTILLGLTKLPPGSTESFNASFMLVAERVPTAVMKSGADVIRAMEEGLKSTPIKAEFQGPIGTERINGADFGVATVRTTMPHGVYMQKFYVTVRKGFALQFVYTYFDEADVPTFEALIKSISLK